MPPRQREVLPVPPREVARRASIAALVLMILGATGLGIGMGWYVHPGLGLAIMSLAVFLVGFMIEKG